MHTIFYQGMSGSQTQLAKYTGKKGFISSTGENVVCPTAIDIVMNPFIGPEIKDVNLQPFASYRSYPLDFILTTKSRAANWWFGIEVSPSSNPVAKYDNGSVYSHSLYLYNISVGQTTDIDSHFRKYQSWEQQKCSTNDSVILFGVSRGAATTFNAMAEFNYQNVKLIVLEGCFFSIGDIMPRTYYWPFSQMVEPALSFFGSYDPKGPSPATNIERFPESVPVVFISSKIDNTVPYVSTCKLAAALHAKGKNDVYLLTLEKSQHPSYMFDDAEDRRKYEIFMHAIYKKYNLPHNTYLAEQGTNVLEESMLLGNRTHNFTCSF